MTETATALGDEEGDRRLRVGDQVRDRHGSNADLTEETATVVEVFEETAAEDYVIETTNRTVAEENPEYPSTDPVVAAVWDGDSAEKHYHFPRSRLVRADRVSRVDPTTLRPSPLNVRSFDRAENADYIEQVATVGGFRSFLVARRTSAGRELLEGHKRRWIAGEAGLETVDVIVEPNLGDREAATWYLEDHWPGLTGEQRVAVSRKLREWLPTAADTLIEETQKE